MSALNITSSPAWSFSRTDHILHTFAHESADVCDSMGGTEQHHADV